MKGLVLGNVDYERHMTSEGKQLQDGFIHAGWSIAGVGFQDGCTDVPKLVSRHNPDIVFVQDKRDWDPASPISFRKDIGFTHLGWLKSRPSIARIAVVKDAGSSHDYHRQFCREIGATAILVYYHPRSVLRQNPWMEDETLVRTWHTVDAEHVARLNLRAPRKRAVVSGAVGNCYPVRRIAFKHAAEIGCDAVKHPGYGNKGTCTPQYLEMLAGYKVHIATASSYAFALRKIIESVACGCTPVTDLPAYDVLPEIDGALVRISPYADANEIREAVARADGGWDLDERLEWAQRAHSWYDWRAMGLRTSEAIRLATRGTSAMEGVPCQG